MPSVTQIRPYTGPQDLVRQYELWLKATDGLPYAWRSNLTNAHYVSQHAADYPRARWYAERDGALVGYIGTHPPVKWPTGEWLMPFGFPWTHPYDGGLERALYDQMVAAVVGLYPEAARPAGYVQRFRGSWTHHLSFLAERGWERRWVTQLVGHSAEADPQAACAARPLDGKLEALAQIAAEDPLEKERLTVESLQRSFAGGWLEPQSTWLVRDDGAFEIEVRRPWGEVRLLLTGPAVEKDATLWRALLAKAAESGAEEVYYTVDEEQVERRAQLERRGFRSVETGVYTVLRATVG
jgi:hypothetical protein